MMLWDMIADVLGASRYTDHAVCLKHDPIIIWMYMIGNLTTAMSCFIIGVTLYFAQKFTTSIRAVKRVLCMVFIFLCGLSHFTEGMTMFSGVYRLDVIVTGVIAGASATTAAITVAYVMSRVVRLET